MEKIKDLKNILGMMLHSDLEAQQLHWNADTQALHDQTEEFYKGIRKLADELVEVSIGVYGKSVVNISHIAVTTVEVSVSTFSNTLTIMMNRINSLTDDYSLPRAIDAILDDIVVLVRTTQYKIKNLK